MEIDLFSRGPRRRTAAAPTFGGVASPSTDYGAGVEVSTPEPRPLSVPGFMPGAPAPGSYPVGQQQTPAPQATAPKGFTGLNQSAIMNYLQGLGGPSTANLRAAFPGMLEQGLIPQGSYLENKATADEIYMPGFGWLDTMVGADTGNPSSWQFSLGGGGGMGNYFSDPLLQGHLNFSQEVIDRLMQPQETNPVLQQAIDRLSRLSYAEDGLQYLLPIAQKRLAQLDQPAFNAGQREMIQTNFADPLERQRTARMEAEKLRLASRGITPESGVFIDQMSDVNRGFDMARAEGGRKLALEEIAANEARQQEAVQIGDLMAGHAGKSLPIQMSAAGQLAGIGQNMQGLDESRLLQALGISGNMSMLPFQAMNYGLGAMDQLQGSIPQDESGRILQLLMSLANQGEGVRSQAQGEESGFWGSLTNALPGILGAFSGIGGGGGGEDLGDGFDWVTRQPVQYEA